MSIRKQSVSIGLGGCLMLGLMLLQHRPAAAQTAPSTSFGLGAVEVPGDMKKKTGKGLAFGRSIFHAGLSFEAGWDSNVFYDDTDEYPASSAYLRLAPELTLGSRPVGEGKKPGFLYNLSVGMDYVGYLQKMGLAKPKQHHVGASLGADLKWNPEGVVMFGIVEQFRRTNEPRVGMDGSIDRDFNTAGLDLNIRKGLLSFLIAYRFTIDIFEQGSLKFANRMLHDFKFKATWRFFPKTSFWFMAQTGYVGYFQKFDEGAPVGSPEAGNRSSVPLRLWLGATGRLTRWFTADIGLGYGFAYYEGDKPEDYHHDVVANVGVGFEMGPTAKLKLGYRHDFRDSAVGDFYKSDSAYVRFDLALFQRLVIQAMGAYTLADYQRYYLEYTSCATSACDRKDNYLLVNISADYYFLTWLSVGLGYVLQANITGFSVDYTEPGQSGVIRPAFLKHRVYGRVTAYY